MNASAPNETSVTDAPEDAGCGRDAHIDFLCEPLN